MCGAIGPEPQLLTAEELGDIIAEAFDDVNDIDGDWSDVAKRVAAELGLPLCKDEAA